MDRTSIVVTATSSTRRLTPMLLVDCPLCDTASPFDVDDDALDCPRCQVRLEVVREDQWVLADAA